MEESDPSEGVIVGRLSVVFGDKNKCEETSGQLRAEPPFHDSIRSLTLSATQKQNRYIQSLPKTEFYQEEVDPI